jgi:hypothetical protein
VAAQVSTSNSVTGNLLVSAEPTSIQVLNCHDGFEHAPSVLSESNTFGDSATGTITSTVSFPAADGVELNPGGPGASTRQLSGSAPRTTSVHRHHRRLGEDRPPSDVQPVRGRKRALREQHPTAPAPAPAPALAPAPVTGILTVTETITYPVTDATASDPKRM